MKALTTDTSLKKSTPHKFLFSNSGKTAFVSIQNDVSVRYRRVAVEQYAGFDSKSLKTLKSLPLKAKSNVSTDSQQ